MPEEELKGEKNLLYLTKKLTSDQHELNSFSFKKKERLAGHGEFNELRKEGNKIFLYPFIIYFKHRRESTFSRVLISVPRKNFKRAVQRNLLKRRIREAYRQDKFRVNPKKYDLAIIYIGKEIVNYQLIKKKLSTLFLRFN